uniref:Chitin-binding type-2 domain-containing protein n=1 Tax=Stomoxys calcitrans TaxID=35570 RepID=A0A1I8NYV0_STOCA
MTSTLRAPFQLHATVGLVFLICGLFISINADCNVCNARTGTACISKTEYKPCFNNVPFGNEVFNCSEGQYCSITGACEEVEALAECKECGMCDATKTFACISTTEFALCLGNSRPSEVRAQCSENAKCNINNPYICGEDPPTCSIRDDPPTTTAAPETTTTTTTTPSPLEDPSGFCSNIQEEGRYPVGTDPATTCHQYINCIKVGDDWYGPLYNCPGQTYYDSAKRTCVTALPPLCNTRVKHLAFRHILLE